MSLLLWLKSSRLGRWLGVAIAAIGFLKLVEAFGARRGKAELTAKQNEQRLKETQLARQDLNDAKSQTDDNLADRLTRGK